MIALAANGAHAQTRILAETSLLEDGRPVRLEIILYKPPGTGPHPVAVISHGSTGNGRNASLFTQTFAPAVLSMYFLRKGFAVAYPQRRGRGHSDGLYDEGFRDDRREGYSHELERSLAGAARGLDDLAAAIETIARDRSLATDRLLLVGQSRGGALSVAYAGRHPERVAAVINFVGGWTNGHHALSRAVNDAVLQQGRGYGISMLWLYGTRDPFYSPDHVRSVHEAFLTAGGKAQLEFLDAGHTLFASPALWSAIVDRYLASIDVRGLPVAPEEPSAEDLSRLVVGKTVTFGFGDQSGSATYFQDGRYVYHGSGANAGVYDIRAGTLCVAFDAGARPCDRITRIGDAYFLTNAGEQSFPLLVIDKE
jgi:pimeloyl-ACP methyl ester carboxylesterase